MSKGLEALKEFKGNSNTILVGRAMGKQHYLNCLQAMEKELMAFQILKKLFHNPDGCSMLALVDWEYPDIAFRIESTDDSWIHTDISKEDFELLKECLE